MADWDDFRFFLALARSGSISEASRSLQVNHTTVSRRIRSLEDKHGVRLFERVRSGYEMTPAAADIYHHAVELEALNQRISRQLFAQDSRLQGTINLTMPHDVFDVCLACDLKIFRDQHPDIDLNLFVSKGLKNLANREADIAIRLTPAPPDYLVGRELYKLYSGVYVSRHLNVASMESVPLVVWTENAEIPEWATDAFPRCHVVLRTDDLYSMYQAVIAGFGVAKMPCYLPDSLHHPEIHRLDIRLPPSTWGVWVLTHVDLLKTAKVNACRTFLLDVMTRKQALFTGALSEPLQKTECPPE